MHCGERHSRSSALTSQRGKEAPASEPEPHFAVPLLQLTLCSQCYENEHKIPMTIELPHLRKTSIMRSAFPEIPRRLRRHGT